MRLSERDPAAVRTRPVRERARGKCSYYVLVRYEDSAYDRVLVEAAKPMSDYMRVRFRETEST